MLILAVGIAEPSTAPRAANRGRVVARLVVRRHRLTEVLQVRAFYFFSFHQEAFNRVAFVIFLDNEITKRDARCFAKLLAHLLSLPAAFRAA